MLPSAFDLLPVLVAAPHLAVFLDFDGTLAPIEAHPDRVWLDAETRASVTRLATVADVAVISGRHLDDLIPRVGIPGIAYGGSHGLELQRPDGRRSDFGDPHTFDDDVRAATAMLEAHRGQHPGTMVERKPFSVAIHYPHAEPTREAHFRAGVRALAERVPRLEVLAGKHVLEFRPRSGWTKGDIVRLLLRAHADGAVGIAMGDDVTDEDAFRALGPQGYSVLVGPEPAWRTSARYGLATPAEVRVWIETLTSVRSGRSVLPARPD